MHYKIKLLNHLIKAITIALLISSFLSSVGYSQEADVIGLINSLKDKNEEVRSKAAEALLETGDAHAVKPLIAALKDEDAGVRWSTAGALGKIKDTRAVDVLLSVLKDRNSEIIAGAYAFFIRRGNPDAEDLLIEALNRDGDIVMAEDFLNCGNSKLEEAAILWAKEHDYNLRRLPNGKGSPVWGQEK